METCGGHFARDWTTGKISQIRYLWATIFEDGKLFATSYDACKWMGQPTKSSPISHDPIALVTRLRAKVTIEIPLGGHGNLGRGRFTAKGSGFVPNRDLSSSVHPICCASSSKMWLALCLGANSSAWFNTAVLVTNMRNFPQSRGTVAGILKGFVGLSAAVFAEVFSGILSKNAVSLLFFLAVGPFLVCCLVMYFVRPCTPASGEDPKEHGYFNFIQAVSIILALYLLLTSIANYILSLDTCPISKLLVVGMLLLLLAPLVVPLKLALNALKEDRADVHKSLDSQISPSREPLLDKEGKGSDPNPIAHIKSTPYSNPILSNKREENNTEGPPKMEVSPPLRSLSSPCLRKNCTFSEIEDMDPEILLAEGEGAVRKRRRPRRGEDFKLRQALVKADFWLLFTVFFCGVGSGVTVLNNLAQIGLAEGFQDVTILLSLISVCNFIGRLGGGVLSEYSVRQKAIPRTIWMTIAQVLMIGAYLFFATALPGSLHIASSILGICYGVHSSVMVPTASELFGLKHFGMIYNFLTIGNPVGAFLFSGLLAGYLYDKEAEKQAGYFYTPTVGGTKAECLGPNCFRLTFLTMAGVCGVGVFLSIILTLRIRPVYETLYGRGSFRIQKSADNMQQT
eukprot:Gb_35226 [translate_table: standard]